MSQRLWWDEDQLPYYELACDGCGASFTCYDDSCYDWTLLRDAALYTGWDTRSDQPDGPHHCPACQRDHRRPRTGNQRKYHRSEQSLRGQRWQHRQKTAASAPARHDDDRAFVR